MTTKPKSEINIEIVGVILGVLIVSVLATAQHVIVFGEIKPTGFVIPILVGSVSGFFIARWFGKLSSAKKEIQTSHERLKLVLEGTEIGLWDWNPQTNETSFDKQWCKLIGYTLDEIKPNFSAWESLVHPEDLVQCNIDIQNHIDGKTEFYQNIHRMKHKDGHWIFVLARGQILERDRENQPIRFTGTHTDITHLKKIEHELEESNNKLKQLSLADGLTGLHNRRAMNERLIQEWGHWKRDQTPFSILLIDIDFFKQFNDSYGHLIGDECLKQIASILEQNAKRTNDIVARFGGEEFLVILAGITSTEALIIATEIHNAIARLAIPHKDSEAGNLITVSIGVNSCDKEQKCSNFQSIIEGADTALYKAKDSGRNQTCLF